MKLIFFDFFKQGNWGLIQLTGPSGCGKTTFCKKYINLNPEILFFDTQFRVFSGTINENISMGNIISDENLSICSKYFLADLTARMYENCSEKDLSTGQIQRINFTRNIINLKNKSIILDEPLSNINSEMYETVILGLKKLCKQNLIKLIIITHNISDKIPNKEMT